MDDERLNPWAYQFRYMLGMDNVTLKPLSDSRAWRLKSEMARNVDRVTDAVTRMEKAHARMKGKP